MAKICVFCASSPAHSPKYSDELNYFSRDMAASRHPLIMGGFTGGKMAIIGQGYLKHGGPELHLIYPNEYAHWEGSFPDDPPNLKRLQTPNLHQRLEQMILMADAFIAFPGGFGTVHEILQVIADNQACMLQPNCSRVIKPMVICNYEGAFNYLKAHFDATVALGYLKADQLERLFTMVDHPRDLLPALEIQLAGIPPVF